VEAGKDPLKTQRGWIFRNHWNSPGKRQPSGREAATEFNRAHDSVGKTGDGKLWRAGGEESVVKGSDSSEPISEVRRIRGLHALSVRALAVGDAVVELDRISSIEGREKEERPLDARYSASCGRGFPSLESSTPPRP
jgi:hypothetical protein